jgi:integrase/recombinase XerD
MIDGGRDRVLLEVAYAGGLRASEIVALTWPTCCLVMKGECSSRSPARGGKVRNVLLPEIVSRSLLSLRGDAGGNDPVFVSQRSDRLTARGVHHMRKAAAKAAGINEAVSPHWLRHAHGSHAIERGASLPRVQQTLGTVTLRRRAAICTHGRTAQAGCA